MSYDDKRHHHLYGHLRTVRQVQASRSLRAKKIDAGLKAPIAKNPEQWLQAPNRYDLPDIDTPERNAEQQETKTQDEQAPRAFQPSPIILEF